VSNRGKAGGKVHRLYENRFGLCQNARQNVRIIPLIQSPSRPSVVDPLAMQVIVEMKLASVRTEDSARAVARHHSCATRHNSAIKKSQPSTIIVNLESSSAEQSRASRHEHHFTWPQRPYTHANKTSRKTFISFPSPPSKYRVVWSGRGGCGLLGEKLKRKKKKTQCVYHSRTVRHTADSDIDIDNITIHHIPKLNHPYTPSRISLRRGPLLTFSVLHRWTASLVCSLSSLFYLYDTLLILNF